MPAPSKLQCQRCLREIQGNSQLCVACFRAVWVRCGQCKGTGWEWTKRRGKKCDWQGHACTWCDGKGWYTTWDGKAIDPKAARGARSPSSSAPETGTGFVPWKQCGETVE